MLIVPMKRNERVMISTDIGFGSRIIDRYTRFEQAAFEEARMDFLKMVVPAQEALPVKAGDVYQVLLQTIYFKMQHTIVTNQKNYQELIDRQMVNALQQLRESFHSREYVSATRLYRQLQHTEDKKELLLLYREVKQKLAKKGIQKEAPELFYDVTNVIRREESVSQIAREYHRALEIRQKEMQVSEGSVEKQDFRWQKSTLENIIRHRSYEQNVSLYQLLEHENLVLREEVKAETDRSYEEVNRNNRIEEQIQESAPPIRQQHTQELLLKVIRQAAPEKLERIIRVITGEDTLLADGRRQTVEKFRESVFEQKEISKKTENGMDSYTQRPEQRLIKEIHSFSEKIWKDLADVTGVSRKNPSMPEDRKREAILNAVRSLKEESAGEIYRYLTEEKLFGSSDRREQIKRDQQDRQYNPKPDSKAVTEAVVLRTQPDNKEVLTELLQTATAEQIKAVYEHMLTVHEEKGNTNSYVSDQRVVGDTKKPVAKEETGQAGQAFAQNRDILPLAEIQSFSEKSRDEQTEEKVKWQENLTGQTERDREADGSDVQYAGRVVSDNPTDSTQAGITVTETAEDATNVIAGEDISEDWQGQPLTQNRDIRLLKEMHSFSEKVFNNLAGMSIARQDHLTDLEDRKRESVLGAVQSLDEEAAGQIYQYLTEENLLYASDGIDNDSDENRNDQDRQTDQNSLKELQADMEALMQAAGKSQKGSKESLTVLLRSASPKQLEEVFDRLLTIYDQGTDDNGLSGIDTDNTATGPAKDADLRRAAAKFSKSLVGQEGQPITQNGDMHLLTQIHSFSEKVFDNLAGMSVIGQGHLTDLEDRKRESVLGAVQSLDEEAAGRIYQYLTEENLLYAADRWGESDREGEVGQKVRGRQNGGQDQTGHSQQDSRQNLQSDRKALFDAERKTGSKEILTVLLKMAAPQQLEVILERLLTVHDTSTYAGGRTAELRTIDSMEEAVKAADGESFAKQREKPFTQNRDIRSVKEVYSFSKKVLDNLAGMSIGRQDHLTDLEDRKRESILGAAQSLDEKAADRIYQYLTEEKLFYVSDRIDNGSEENRNDQNRQTDQNALKELQAGMDALMQAAGKSPKDSKEALAVLLRSATPKQLEEVFERLLTIYDQGTDDNGLSGININSMAIDPAANADLRSAAGKDSGSLVGQEGQAITQNRDMRLLTQIHSFSEKVLDNLAGMSIGRQDHLTDLEDRKRESILGAAQSLDEEAAGQIYQYLTEKNLLYTAERRFESDRDSKDGQKVRSRQSDWQDQIGWRQQDSRQNLQPDMEALMKAGGKPQTGGKETLMVLLQSAAPKQMEAMFDHMLTVYDEGINADNHASKEEPLTAGEDGREAVSAATGDGKTAGQKGRLMTQSRDIRLLTEKKSRQTAQSADTESDSGEQGQQLQMAKDIKHFSERVIDHMTTVTLQQQGVIGDIEQLQRQSVLKVLAEADGQETKNLYQYLVMEELVHHRTDTREEAEQEVQQKSHEDPQRQEVHERQWHTTIREQLREWVNSIDSEQLGGLSERILEIYDTDLSALVSRLAEKEIARALAGQETQNRKNVQAGQNRQGFDSLQNPRNLKSSLERSGGHVSQVAQQTEADDRKQSLTEDNLSVTEEPKQEKLLTIREDFERQITDRYTREKKRIDAQEKILNPVSDKQRLLEAVTGMSEEESMQIYTALKEHDFVFRKEEGDVTKQLLEVVENSDVEALAMLQTIFREGREQKQDLPEIARENGLSVLNSAEIPKILRLHTLQTILKDVRIGSGKGMTGKQAEREAAVRNAITPRERAFVPSLVMLQDHGENRDLQSKRIGIMNYYLAGEGQKNAVMREQLLQVVYESMDQKPETKMLKENEQAFTQFLHTADTVAVEKIFDTMMERSDGFRQMAEKLSKGGEAGQRQGREENEALKDYVTKRNSIQIPAYEETEPLRYRAAEVKESVTEELEKRIEQNVADYVKVERDERKVVARESRETRQIVDKQVKKIKALTKKLEEQEEEIKRLTITSKNNVVDYGKVRENVMSYLERELRLEKMRRGLD